MCWGAVGLLSCVWGESDRGDSGEDRDTDIDRMGPARAAKNLRESEQRRGRSSRVVSIIFLTARPLGLIQSDIESLGVFSSGLSLHFPGWEAQ